MKPFQFCPACATRLEQPEDSEGLTCPGCGRTWYRNSAPTAGGVIVRAGRALITERGIDPFKGLYDVPGGFLRAGEDPIDGLKREMREELGVEVEVRPSDLVQAATHTYGAEGDYVLALGYKARLVSGEPVPADDVAAIRWVEAGELDGTNFAWEHDRELVRTALEEENDG